MFCDVAEPEKEVRVDPSNTHRLPGGRACFQSSTLREAVAPVADHVVCFKKTLIFPLRVDAAKYNPRPTAVVDVTVKLPPMKLMSTFERLAPLARIAAWSPAPESVRPVLTNVALTVATVPVKMSPPLIVQEVTSRSTPVVLEMVMLPSEPQEAME